VAESGSGAETPLHQANTLRSLSASVNKLSNSRTGTVKPADLPPAQEGFEILDNGRLRIATKFLSLLQANGLDTFEKIMASPAGQIVRSFPGRNTVRLDLKHPGGEVGRFFLKRYESSYLSSWRFFLRAIHWPGAEDEAMREWRAALTLRSSGFNTAIPVAVGQTMTGGVVTRSFVMTAEIAGGVCAHNAIPSFTATQRRAFALESGELTRRLHHAGFVHKDYYLYHIFVVPKHSPAESLQLALIDLQRVVRPVWLRERWLIKDLAALAYSARRVGMSRTTLARFFRVYRGHTRLSDQDKQLARKVLKRVRWLNSRQPKHDRLA
jgi:hypothetical protein